MGVEETAVAKYRPKGLHLKHPKLALGGKGRRGMVFRMGEVKLFKSRK